MLYLPDTGMVMETSLELGLPHVSGPPLTVAMGMSGIVNSTMIMHLSIAIFRPFTGDTL